MQDLARYAKRETIEIHTRYLSLLIGGSAALLALVFALGLLVGSQRAKAPTCPEVDPLAALDAKAKEPPVPQRAEVPLSFHELLAAPSALPSGRGPSIDEGAEDRDAVERVPVRTRGEEAASLEDVPGEEPGVYTLQVGSFQNAAEAEDMVRRLSNSGFRSFLVAVNMPDRGGKWYRVRVGPFETKKEAWTSKLAFEQKVRIPAFVVKKKTDGAARGATNLTQAGRAPKRG